MPDVKPYQRAVTPIERFLFRSPFSIVTMVTRIRGTVTEGMLRAALDKVRLRHPNLRVRIVPDENGDPWLTSEGAGEIQVETVSRASDDHWIGVVRQWGQVPFEFDARPAVRFILVGSPAASELIIVCHHVLCDGLSLAYLARDLLAHLGDPGRPAEPLPDPAPIGLDNMPPGVAASGLVRFMINRMNKKWAAEKVLFDQEDYRAVNNAYWTRYQHQALPVELSEAQTTALVERCRKEGVTANSALCAAFVGAQVAVLGEPLHPSVGVAASLRDRLPRPAGEVMGFYAGMVRPKFGYDGGRGFWDNARRFHRQVSPLFTDRKLFEGLLAWCYLDPTILEAINYKKLGGLVPPDSPRYDKLSAFGGRDDTVRSILKRERMASLDQIAMGTAVTNLARLDFARRYGPLELERLIIKPGAAYPLSTVGLVLGAVTCAGRLSLLVEFAEENIDLPAMGRIRDRALELLLGD